MRRLSVRRRAGLSVSALALMLGSAVGAQERQAFYGETHVHTSWSFDAYIFGNHLTGPADADLTPVAHPPATGIVG
jgi:hypothetical protein